MNTVELRGSLVALVTPMSEQGEIDYQALKELIDWHIAEGTHGLVIMGTTGESSLVSQDELVEVVKVAIDHTANRIPIIAGCGSASTAAVVELVKRLNRLKPDAFLCVTPYYVKPSQQGLIAHYQAIADVCQAPLILYNVPGRTACDLNNASVLSLSQHPNIIGIKDAVGDVERAQALFTLINQQASSDDFLFFSGDDETAFDYVKQGGHGVISVTANIAPKAMSQWCELLLDQTITKENKELAASIFEKLMPLHQNLFVEANPIPVKWALMQINKIPQGIRLPLTLPSQASQTIINNAVKAALTLD
jgi:4-hydroxy-tetrahydrodipicolinate synthase